MKLLQSIRHWPKGYIALSGAMLILATIAASWFWPTQMQFSYGGSNCMSQFIFAPDAFRSKSYDGLRLTSEGVIQLGNITIASTKMCLIPLTAPKEGGYQVGLAPFGSDLIMKHITIVIPKPPVALVKVLQKPLPVTQRLNFPLTAPDKIFSYKITVNDKQLECQTNAQTITCDLKKLSLEQGATYSLSLQRYFHNVKVANIISQPIETLKPTNIIATSIKPNEIIYSKPRSIEISLDKPINQTTAQMVKLDGKTRQPIQTKTTVDNNKLTISWDDDLPRASSYELILDNLLAQDGSTLVKPYVLPFQVSGGPKIVSVNIGQLKVAFGTTVVVTFDQSLLETQDINKAVSVTGGATITGFKDNQLFVSTAGVPKCGDFSIKINDNLLSSYSIAGGSAWQYASRMLCHTVSSIGTSVKGRAILAYYFGDGPNTIIYDGAIHGDETNTQSLLLSWIDDLEANARSIPADKTIVVIPLLNPDGAAAGTRTNAHNVDLNRNFDVSDWKTDVVTVTNAPFPGGGGPAPMSEPETRAIAQLVARLRPRLVLSYHSVAGIVAGNLAGDSGAIAGAYASLSGYRNATGVTDSVFAYESTGTADDYYAEKLGVQSLLIELGSKANSQFSYNQKAMWLMTRQ